MPIKWNTGARIRPWDRQVGEPHKSYQRFLAYRDMGVGRTLVKVGVQLGVPHTALEAMSARNGWQLRVKAWDDEQDRLKHEESLEIARVEHEGRLRRIKDMNQRHAQAAALAFRIVLQRLVGDEANGIKPLNPNTLNAFGLTKLMETAAKLERLSLGLPSDKIIGELTGPDGGPVRVQHERGDGDEERGPEFFVEVARALEESGVMAFLRSATETDADQAAAE